MPRPSRKTDQALIETGRQMIEQDGLTNLNIRELASRAGVNLGMFHYHFKSKEAFVRIVLQEIYDEVFTKLSEKLSVESEAPTLLQLERVLMFLAQFTRDNCKLLCSILTDLATGSPLARDFVKTNFPRHVGLVHGLVVKAQAEGNIVKLPVPNIMAFIASGLAIPNLAAGLISNLQDPDLAFFPPILEQFVLPDQAIQQRIHMILKGISP